MKTLKIIFILSLFILFPSCNRKAYKLSGEQEYSMMYNGIYKALSIYQLDSVIKADKLPIVNKWIESSYKDFETNEPIILRTLYIENDTASLVYRVENIGNDSVFLTKRVMVKELQKKVNKP